MKQKVLAIFAVLVVFLASCSNFTTIGGKVYQNAYGNLTPAINSTFTIGNPTHYFESAYIEHIYTSTGAIGASNVTTVGGTADYVAKFNSATNIVNSRIKDNTTAIYIGGDLFTDRWAAPSPMNTFVGMGVAGAGNLVHTAPGDGDANTAVGWNSVHAITTGKFNTAIGDQALTSVTTGIGNTAVGEIALGSQVGTSFNTGIGADVLWQNTGSYNSALGVFAGGNNLVGDRNVFLGYAAGQNELGSDKLYIDNSNTATPLIYGDFSNNTVIINNNLSMAGNITMVAGNTVDGVDVSTLGAGVANPLPDDVALGFGTGTTTSFLWETADANANAMVIALPNGGATDVPVLVIGDQSVINKDLTFFNGLTTPRLVMMKEDETSYSSLFYYGYRTTGDMLLQANNGGTYYIKFASTGSVPTLFGVGAYLRIGDAGTTSHTLASEDDLMVSGQLEVDGTVSFDGTVNMYGQQIMQTGSILRPLNTDNTYFRIQARDNDVGLVEVARVQGAADPYFQMTLACVFNPTTQPGTPVKGMVFYNTTTNKLNLYNGTAWEIITSAP
jgi:hypothetical protein